MENKEKQREVADIIISEADRLDQLVSNILLVIKSENQTLPLNKKEYDLALLIRQTVNRFSKKINEKKISFAVDVPPLLTTLCDAQQIMRVLDNLISNSIQHIDNKRSIMINAKKKKKYIRIEVINTGKHIPKEHIDNLFDPFYRVDLSRSRESGGTGLGLAVVKSIVLAHGGIFGVENIKNSVCFWFDIPAKVASH